MTWKYSRPPGPVREHREPAPAVVVRPVEEGRRDPVLLADHVVETLGVRVQADDRLEVVKGAVVLLALRKEVAGPVKGLGGVDRPAVFLGHPLIEGDRRDRASFFLVTAGAVHEVQRRTPGGAGQAGKGAALDLPTASGDPGKVGGQPRGHPQRKGRRQPEGQHGAAENKGRHVRGNHQRIRALP